ncbi:MAG: hypothetical protein FLDDKLPJ_03270 [Phycisphaerae bacterium]|nr:hypothetical protein [Phycisphaerae bacterium]MCG3132425.1 hypothetical protein [Phycisphaerae bacterium]
MHILQLMAWWCSLLFQDQLHKPTELIEAERYRGRVTTAQVDWVLIPPADSGDEREALYTSRVAFVDTLEIFHGLADGRGHALAEPGVPFSYSERRLLIKDGEQWKFYYDTPAADVNDIPDRHMLFRNLRDLGFEPTAAWSAHPSWYRQPAASYDSAEHLEDRVLVTGHWDNGMSVRWTLDPEKGMQPVRVEMLNAGEVVGACDSEYEQFDGLWFPKTCTFSHRRSTTVVIGVLSAEFNRSEHPRELTPNDLGMVPGTQVSHTTLKQTAWTGEKLIPLIDWLNMVEAGEADNSAWDEVVKRCQSPTGLGRYPKTMNDDFLGLTSAVTRKPGLWEDYTRRFIQRFRLQGAQVDRAWSHLKECQKPAYAYLDEHKSAIREAEEELAKVTNDLDRVTSELTKVTTEPAKVEAAPAKPDPKPIDAPNGAAPNRDAPNRDVPNRDTSNGGASNRDARATGSAPDRLAAPGVGAEDPAASDDILMKRRSGLQAQRETLDERLKKLYEPIEKIFEEKLKPGLAKLPTQKQIVAARARETDHPRVTAPAPPPDASAAHPAPSPDGERR